MERALVFAMANNGKKLTSYERSLDLEESKIGKSEAEIKKSKAVKQAEYKIQKTALMNYLDRIGKEKKDG